MPAQSRNWCLTTFEVDDFCDNANGYLVGELSFLVYQVERCPRTDALHVQGYVEFSRRKRMNAVKEFFDDETMHLEPRSGTQAEAIAYCEKEDTREAGPFRVGAPRPQAEGARRTDLSRVLSMIDDGSYNSLGDVFADPEVPAGDKIRYHRGFEKYLVVMRTRTVQSAPPDNVIYWGPSGSGKSRRAHDEAAALAGGAHLVFYHGGQFQWYDGYLGQLAAVFDDVRWDSIQMHLSFVLKLLDRYPVSLPVKCGYVNWRVTHTWWTTNEDPAYWFEVRPELSRRFRVVYIG